MKNDPLSDILKDFNLFVDDVGFAGNVTSCTLPTLEVKTDDLKTAGLEAPLGNDMGLNKMEAKWTLTKVDAGVLAKWGLASQTKVKVTLKGALVDYHGNVKALNVNFNGMIRKVEQGEMKPGERSDTTYTMEVIYYKLTIAGADVYEIDIMNGVRKINGVDQREKINAALGNQ